MLSAWAYLMHQRRRNDFHLLKKNILISNFDLNGAISAIYKANPSSFDSIVKPEYSTTPGNSDINNVFNPSNTGHSYICGDNYSHYYQVSFKKLYIAITGYIIRSEPLGAYLRYWNFSGSNDGKTWKTLHYNWNNEKIKASNTTYTFTCTKRGIYKYFRILQTGKSSAQNACIAFSQIDLIGRILFGNLITSYNSRDISSFYYFVVFLIC